MSMETLRSHRSRMVKVLEHLDQATAEASAARYGVDGMPGLDELASIAGMSPHHFHRVFKACVGMPVKAYVRRHRLLLAVDKLGASDKSILDVALETGFSSHETFTRAFSQAFGITPSGYRKRTDKNLPMSRSMPPLPCQQSTLPGDDMEPSITELPEMTVAKVRHVGPYANCQPAWDTLCSWGARHGLFGPQTLFLGISWDDPDSTQPEDIRYDACFTLPKDATATPQDGVEISVIGKGRYAIAQHKGPFHGLEEAYRKLYTAVLAREDLRLSDDPALEIYRSDPKTTPPEELLTEICLPLKD